MRETGSTKRRSVVIAGSPLERCRQRAIAFSGKGERGCAMRCSADCALCVRPELSIICNRLKPGAARTSAGSGMFLALAFVLLIAATASAKVCPSRRLYGRGAPGAGLRSLYVNPGYDPLKDFAPIGLVASRPIAVIAHPSFPATSIAELIALAKKQGKPRHRHAPARHRKLSGSRTVQGDDRHQHDDC